MRSDGKPNVFTRRRRQKKKLPRDRCHDAAKTGSTHDRRAKKMQLDLHEMRRQPTAGVRHKEKSHGASDQMNPEFSRPLGKTCTMKRRPRPSFRTPPHKKNRQKIFPFVEKRFCSGRESDARSKKKKRLIGRIPRFVAKHQCAEGKGNDGDCGIQYDENDHASIL